MFEAWRPARARPSPPTSVLRPRQAPLLPASVILAPVVRYGCVCCGTGQFIYLAVLSGTGWQVWEYTTRRRWATNSPGVGVFVRGARAGTGLRRGAAMVARAPGRPAGLSPPTVPALPPLPCTRWCRRGPDPRNRRVAARRRRACRARTGRQLPAAAHTARPPPPLARSRPPAPGSRWSARAWWPSGRPRCDSGLRARGRRRRAPGRTAAGGAPGCLATPPASAPGASGHWLAGHAAARGTPATPAPVRVRPQLHAPSLPSLRK